MAEPTDVDFENALRVVPDEKWAAIEDDFARLPELMATMEWKGGERNESGSIQMPWVDYGEGISRLQMKLYDAGLVVPFAWMKWDTPLRQAEPHVVRRASVADAMRLLTGIVRSDRFSEGALKSAYDAGTMAAIFDNMKAWRHGLEGPAEEL